MTTDTRHKPKTTKTKTKTKTEKKKDKNENPLLLKDLDKPAQTSLYYGFTPIKTPQITKEDINKLSLVNECCHTTKKEGNAYFPPPEEKIAVLRTYMENNMANMPHPVMLYYKKPFGGQAVAKKDSKTRSFNLEILGSGSSVSEAIAIKATLAILEEDGYADLSVDINSIGDKESITKYEKDLCSYFKKNMSAISAELRLLFKQDVFEILRCDIEKYSELIENAPKSMSSLSDSSIQHFKQVLEYLEVLNIPYKINNCLVPNKNYCSQTFFEIRGKLDAKKDAVLLAVGTRHNHLSKKAGFKKEIPMMSLSANYKILNASEKTTLAKNILKPKFYFIQLGEKAKLKSLHVIETLRKVRTPVYHSLTKDKLVGQLTTAENLKASYVIIMGQKEAMENSVVIRDMNTRAQDTVSIIELQNYVKTLTQVKQKKNA